jgi:hypothetical protein
VIRTWHALLAPGIKHLQGKRIRRKGNSLLTSTIEMDNDEAIARLCVNAVRVLVELIQDPTFGHNAPVSSVVALEHSLEEIEPLSSLTVKYTIVHGLWGAMRQVIPRAPLAECAPDVFAALFSNSGGLDADADALALWARACADVLVLCDVDDLKAFCAAARDEEGSDVAFEWDTDARAVVWQQLAGTWIRDAEACLEGAILLLGTQFTYVVALIRLRVNTVDVTTGISHSPWTRPPRSSGTRYWFVRRTRPPSTGKSVQLWWTRSQ